MFAEQRALDHLLFRLDSTPSTEKEKRKRLIQTYLNDYHEGNPNNCLWAKGDIFRLYCKDESSE